MLIFIQFMPFEDIFAGAVNSSSPGRSIIDNANRD